MIAPMNTSHQMYFTLLLLCILSSNFCLVVESNDFGISGLIYNNNNNNGNSGSGCRLVMEKNEWASGCM